MIEHTVKLTGQPGTFLPTSFTEWIGHLVDITGLDPSMHHVLRAVENTADGTSSTLTISTYSDAGPDLAAAMSVRVGTPTCPVQAYVGGTLIASAQMEAPLHPGQLVRVGTKNYSVTAVSYPNRQPDGTTTGDDYQHADLAESTASPLVADLGAAAIPAAVATLLAQG